MDYLLLNSSQDFLKIHWFLALFFFLAWILTIFLFFGYRNRSKKRMHKLKGRLAVKNHQTAKAMLDSEEKFKKIIGHMNEGLLLTDADHRIIFANECSCGILGIRQEELLGRKLEELAVGASDAARIVEAMEKKKSGCTTREELRLVKGNNDMFWASLSISYPSDLKEVTGGAIVVLVDMSRHIQLEQKLQKLTTSLVQKVKQMNCLFDVQQIIGEPDSSTEEMFNRLVKVIPGGLRYEVDMAVEILFEGKRYATSSYRETKWVYQAPLKAKGIKKGHLSVSYMGPEPARQQKPFRIGEKILIRNIAEKVSLAL